MKSEVWKVFIIYFYLLLLFIIIVYLLLAYSYNSRISNLDSKV